MFGVIRSPWVYIGVVCCAVLHIAQALVPSVLYWLTELLQLICWCWCWCVCVSWHCSVRFWCCLIRKLRVHIVLYSRHMGHSVHCWYGTA